MISALVFVIVVEVLLFKLKGASGLEKGDDNCNFRGTTLCKIYEKILS